MVALPEVLLVVEVPGRRVAHHLSVGRFPYHGFVPELFRHGHQTNRREEFLRQFEQPFNSVILEETLPTVSDISRLFVHQFTFSSAFDR